MTKLLRHRLIGIADLLTKRLHIRQQRPINRFTTKFPDHRTQFIFGMKADAMVNGPQPLIGANQTMTTFAIGIVDNKVKEGQLT